MPTAQRIDAAAIAAATATQNPMTTPQITGGTSMLRQTWNVTTPSVSADASMSRPAITNTDKPQKTGKVGGGGRSSHLGTTTDVAATVVHAPQTVATAII